MRTVTRGQPAPLQGAKCSSPSPSGYAGKALDRLCAVSLCLLPALIVSPVGASRRLETTTQYCAVRTGPSTDYNRITMLMPSVPLWAEDKQGDWYRVRLHQALEGWVHQEDLRASDRQGRPMADVANIQVAPYERGVRVTVLLTERIPYRVRQCIGTEQLKLDLFGARLARYGIRCYPIEPFVTSVVPEQVLSDWAEVTLNLKMPVQTGYDVYYAGQRAHLVVDVRRPLAPGGLRGKVVCLDPGHGGGDKGAVGPSGLLEKDVNLAIGLRLRELLLARGATVVMTRQTDASLAPPGSSLRTELSARVLATKRLWPDIFLSIHNNHIGSGDPSSVRGTETYYYSPMSIRPAWAIHNALCRALSSQSRFVGWRPFRVLRETDTPRVLVECAYMSHPQEEAIVRDESFPAVAAEGLLQGLSDYFTSASRSSADAPGAWAGNAARRP